MEGADRKERYSVTADIKASKVAQCIYRDTCIYVYESHTHIYIYIYSSKKNSNKGMLKETSG